MFWNCFNFKDNLILIMRTEIILQIFPGLKQGACLCAYIHVGLEALSCMCVRGGEGGVGCQCYLNIMPISS